MIVHLLLRRRKRILSAILQGIPFLGSFNSYKGFWIPVSLLAPAISTPYTFAHRKGRGSGCKIEMEPITTNGKSLFFIFKIVHVMSFKDLIPILSLTTINRSQELQTGYLLVKMLCLTGSFLYSLLKGFVHIMTP